MSPRLVFTLALAGVLLAGAPLLWLTAPARHAPASQKAAPAKRQAAFVSLKFTGKPVSATLRLEGSDLAAMPAGQGSPWELELPLPSDAPALELEAEVHWPEGSPENAATLTVEPVGREGRSDTQWTGADGSLLHTIFSFAW